jgi:hypothetical protein
VSCIAGNQIDSVRQYGFIIAKLSFTAFGEPGRLMINVPEQTPETPLEIIAIGVCFKVSTLIASEIPCASLSMTCLVASECCLLDQDLCRGSENQIDVRSFSTVNEKLYERIKIVRHDLAFDNGCVRVLQQLD